MKFNPKLLTILITTTFASTVLPAAQIQAYTDHPAVIMQSEERLSLNLKENLDNKPQYLNNSSENIEYYETKVSTYPSEVDVNNYHVAFKVTGDWFTGYNGEIIITNNNDKPLKDWQIEFDFEGNIDAFWEAEIVSHVGNHYVIKNKEYNADINPGQTINLEFQGTPGNININPGNYKIISLKDNQGSSQEESSEVNYKKYTGNGYEIEYKVNERYYGGYNGEVVITNTGNIHMDNWSVEFDLPHEIKTLWNGVIIKQEGNSYRVKNAQWNQDISVGASVSFGFSINCDKVVLPELCTLILEESQLQESTYDVDFNVTSDWGSAYIGEFKITNNTQETFEDWVLEFDFEGDISTFWDADIISCFDNHYIIKNKGYNANIQPKDTIYLGFTGTPGNISVVPSNYDLYQMKGENIDDGATDDKVDNPNDKPEDSEEEIPGDKDDNEEDSEEEIPGDKDDNEEDSEEETPGDKDDNEEDSEEEIPGDKDDNEEDLEEEIPGDKDDNEEDSEEETPGDKDDNEEDSEEETPGDKDDNEEDSEEETPGDKDDNEEDSEEETPGDKDDNEEDSEEETPEDKDDNESGDSGNNGSGDNIVDDSNNNPPNDSDNSNENVEETGFGIIKGMVISAVDKTGIDGVKITVNDDEEYFTNSNGNFSIKVKANINHKLKIEKEGYNTEYYYYIRVEKDEIFNLLTILQTPMSEAQKGSVKGRVLNAITGDGMPDITLNIRKGLNSKDGEIIATTISNSDGTFLINNLSNGNYTAELISDNTITTYFTFTSIDVLTDIGDITVSPNLNPNEMRIVLTWGKEPVDLDAYMNGAGQNISYMNKKGVGIVLDVDDVDSYGPETITINFDELPEGIYKYSVKWFYGKGTWMTSNAKVIVYLGSKVVGEFYPPTTLRNKEIWNVFELDSTTRKIKTL